MYKREKINVLSVKPNRKIDMIVIYLYIGILNFQKTFKKVYKNYNNEYIFMLIENYNL